MALGSMPSRIRNLQLEAASEQDWERRNRQRAEAEAMLAEEEASVGPRPAPMVAPPKGVPAERGGVRSLGPAPLGDARLRDRPKLDAAGRNAVIGQEKVGESIGRGIQAVGDFAGSAGAAAAGVMKPGRMQELAKPVADGMEQLGRTMDSAEGRAVADKVEDSNARRDRRKQMGKISDEERAAAEAQFNVLWEADDGAIRATYTTEDGRPDFQSFLDDMVEPGEDPRAALGRVMQNIAGRDGGVDGAGRKIAGYTTPVTPVAPPSADEAEKQSRAAKPFVPGASRLPRGVTRPNAFSAKPSGGENGQGQNRIRVGMAAHTNAHELAGDQRHDMEPENGGFPTTMDKWAKLFQENNNPDDERAYVLMFAQQNGFDFTGVPEEDQYDAAQRMTAETLFRYGDAEQKKWAKGWGNLKGDRWHISMKRDDKGNRSPVATQPMRTAAWDPTTGTFVESATEFARGQTQRLRDISDTREAVKRSPTNFMDENDFIQQMGEDNWNSLTPAQKAKFLGEAARGMEVHRNNVNSARNREIAANTPRARGWYQEEMGKASTPLDMFRVAQKYGDMDAMDRIGQIISGDQAAAAAARPGEPSPADEAGRAARVQDGMRKEAGARGDVQGALEAAGYDAQNPASMASAAPKVAADEVEEWKASGDLDPQGLILKPRMQPYLRDLADSKFGHAFLPGDTWPYFGESDVGPGRGNATMAKAFAERVIADRGLQGIEGMEQALIDWWRGHHGFKDAYVPSPQDPGELPAPTEGQNPGLPPPGSIAPPW